MGSLVILAGIDEAGYGPRLGPLVVAANAVAVPGRIDPRRPWPQWHLVDAGALRVADSKGIYSSSRGIASLERAVLSFAQLTSHEARDLEGFLRLWVMEGAGEALGLPWYSGRLELPCGCAVSEIHQASGSLRRCLLQEGVQYLGAWMCVVDEIRYNGILERLENKATLLFGRAALLMQELWRRFGDEGICLTVDRQGGRKFYGGLLDIAFPHAHMDVLLESDESSIYRLRQHQREMLVRFKVRADTEDTTVALSSMWAKYTRELFMELFNGYWLERAGGVARTAGYWEDGERFLAQLVASRAMTEREAARIRRIR